MVYSAVVARRGLARGRRTRTFSIHDLRREIHDSIARLASTTRHDTVYVETDGEGFVCGARGESAARVAASARPAPPPAAPSARPRADPAAVGTLYLELVTGVAPHHDLTVWPPLHLLLLPAPAPAPAAAPVSHATGVGVGGATDGPRAGRGGGGGHECRYCGRRYSRRYGLRIHERTHTGARPLRCPHCDRAFADPSNLNKHVRLHRRDTAGDIPCPRCPRRVARRRDLLRHLRSHDDVIARDEPPRVK